MLQALGYRFLDSGGSDIRRGAIGLKDLKEIDDSGAMTVLKGCRFEIASDVTNPLCGPCGASYVFAPQKGASPEQVALLDEGLRHFATLMPPEVPQTAGAGAAGGVGAGRGAHPHGLEGGVGLRFDAAAVAGAGGGLAAGGGPADWRSHMPVSRCGL